MADGPSAEALEYLTIIEARLDLGKRADAAVVLDAFAAAAIKRERERVRRLTCGEPPIPHVKV